MANNDSNTTLYNGRFTAKFSNYHHKYHINGELKPGVTTMIGQTIAKPDLMLWPLTTALRELRAKLGITLTEADLASAFQAHVDIKNKASDAGTMVHSFVEEILRTGNNQRFYPAQSEEVRQAMRAFQDWYAEKKPKVIAVEQVVYSERYDFCGTLDSILHIDGRTYLCDLKTTKASRTAPRGVYAENFIQLGFYALAYAEQFIWETVNGGTSLVPLNALMILSCRKDGQLDIVTNEDVGLTVPDCIKMAKHTYKLYKALQETKAKLGGF